MNMEQDLGRYTFREKYKNGARGEAFAYVWEHRDDAATIQERIRGKEESLSDPSRQTGSLAPGSSVRLYMEGFVEGMRQALDLLAPASGNGRKKGSSTAELAVLFYRSILEAKARFDAIVFAGTHNIEEVEGWVQEVEQSDPDLFLVKIKEQIIETDTADRVSDEDALKSSIPLSDSLHIYYQAYLDGLRDVLEKAQETSIRVVSTEAQC